jgi:transcriptional regulator of met regulon
MKRLVTITGPVAAAQMDGYLIEDRLLDRIMIQVIDKGHGNLEIAFDERDQRYLSQFSAAQLAEWLQEAMLHVEAACPLETREGKPAWIADEAPPRVRASIKAMRPARQEHDLPAGLEFLRRT